MSKTALKIGGTPAHTLSFSHLLIAFLSNVNIDEMAANSDYFVSLLRDHSLFSANNHIPTSTFSSIITTVVETNSAPSYIAQQLTIAANAGNAYIAKLFDKFAHILSDQSNTTRNAGFKLMETFITSSDRAILSIAAPVINDILLNIAKTSNNTAVIYAHPVVTPSSSAVHALHLLVKLLARSQLWTDVSKVIQPFGRVYVELLLSHIGCTLFSETLQSRGKNARDKKSIMPSPQTPAPSIRLHEQHALTHLTPQGIAVLQISFSSLYIILSSTKLNHFCKNYIPQIHSICLRLADVTWGGQSLAISFDSILLSQQILPKIQSQHPTMILIAKIFALSCHAGRNIDVRQTLGKIEQQYGQNRETYCPDASTDASKATKKGSKADKQAAKTGTAGQPPHPSLPPGVTHPKFAQFLYSNTISFDLPTHSDASTTGSAAATKKDKNSSKLKGQTRTVEEVLATTDKEHSIVVDTTKTNKKDAIDSIVGPEKVQRGHAGSNHALGAKISQDNQLAEEYMTDEKQFKRQSMYQQQLHEDVVKTASVMLMNTLYHELSLLTPSNVIENTLFRRGVNDAVITLVSNTKSSSSSSSTRTAVQHGYQLAPILKNIAEIPMTLSRYEAQQNRVITLIVLLQHLLLIQPESEVVSHEFLLTDLSTLNSRHTRGGKAGDKASSSTGAGAPGRGQTTITQNSNTALDITDTLQLSTQSSYNILPISQLLRFLVSILELPSSLTMDDHCLVFNMFLPRLQQMTLYTLSTMIATCGRQIIPYVDLICLPLVQLTRGINTQTNTGSQLNNHNYISNQLVLKQHIYIVCANLISRLGAVSVMRPLIQQIFSIFLLDIVVYFNDLTILQHSKKCIRPTLDKATYGESDADLDHMTMSTHRRKRLRKAQERENLRELTESNLGVAADPVNIGTRLAAKLAQQNAPAAPTTSPSDKPEQEEQDRPNADDKSDSPSTSTTVASKQQQQSSKTVKEAVDIMEKAPSFISTAQQIMSSQMPTGGNSMTSTSITKTSHVYLKPTAFLFHSDHHRASYHTTIVLCLQVLISLYSSPSGGIACGNILNSSIDKTLVLAIHLALQPQGTAIFPIPVKILEGLFVLLKHAIVQQNSSGILSPILSQAITYMHWALSAQSYPSLASIAAESLVLVRSLTVPVCVVPILSQDVLYQLNNVKQSLLSTVNDSIGASAVATSLYSGVGEVSTGQQQSSQITNTNLPMYLFAYQDSLNASITSRPQQDSDDDDDVDADVDADVDGSETLTSTRPSLDDIHSLALSNINSRLIVLNINHQQDGDDADQNQNQRRHEATTPSQTAASHGQHGQTSQRHQPAGSALHIYEEMFDDDGNDSDLKQQQHQQHLVAPLRERSLHETNPQHESESDGGNIGFTLNGNDSDDNGDDDNDDDDDDDDDIILDIGPDANSLDTAQPNASSTNNDDGDDDYDGPGLWNM